LFLAGSFNAWNPENRNFGFQKNKKDGVSDSVGQGTYWLGIKLAGGMYEFKLRGEDGIRWSVKGRR